MYSLPIHSSANPAIIQLKNNPDDEAGDENIQHMIRVRNYMKRWINGMMKSINVVKSSFIVSHSIKAIKALLDAKS